MYSCTNKQNNDNIIIVTMLKCCHWEDSIESQGNNPLPYASELIIGYHFFIRNDCTLRMFLIKLGHYKG